MQLLITSIAVREISISFFVPFGKIICAVGIVVVELIESTSIIAKNAENYLKKYNLEKLI
jgi:hypothetical protein